MVNASSAVRNVESEATSEKIEFSSTRTRLCCVAGTRFGLLGVAEGRDDGAAVLSQ